MGPLANSLSSLGDLLASLLISICPGCPGSMPVDCPTQIVHIMPADRWVCLPVQKEDE
jgi:hypothetical protein